MANEEAILRALNGLVGGIRTGIEQRRQNALDAEKLRLQRDELALRHDERTASLESTKAYHQATLAQKADTESRIRAIENTRTGQAGAKIAQDDYQKAVDDERVAQDKLDGINKDIGKIKRSIELGGGDKEFVSGQTAMLTELEKSRQEMQDIKDRAKLRSIRHEKKPGGRSVDSVAPKGTRSALDLATDPNVDYSTSYKAVDEARKSGKLKGADLDSALDALIVKKGRQGP